MANGRRDETERAGPASYERVKIPLQILRNLAVAGLFFRCIAAAQSAQSAQVTIQTLPKRFVIDELKILKSPFRKSSYSTGTVKKYVVPFALISAALIATDRHTLDGHTLDALPNTRDQTVWSGRASQLGSAYSLIGVSGGAYLVGKFKGNQHAQESGLLAFEALGHAQIATFALKQLTNRERPLEHDRRGGFWEGGNSFPSGHAASIFAVATVFAYEYRDHPAVPILAYSLATAVSASRLSASKHWLSDIFVGGSIGFLMGRSTFNRHHQAGLNGKLMPQVGVSPSGAALAWRF